MCYPVRCRACGKTTWGGCGLHIESVKRLVPQEQWCDGHADRDPGPARASFIARIKRSSKKER